VTVEVQKSHCEKAKGPVDPCLCNDVCYYDVTWKKENAEIQCFATRKGAEDLVADRVCEFRGARKPTAEEWNAAKVQKGTRGTYPENLEHCWSEKGEAELTFVESLSTGTWLAALFWLLA
jgi:hypothetical protein